MPPGPSEWEMWGGPLTTRWLIHGDGSPSDFRHSGEWETTCILSGGVSRRVASGYNTEKQKAEQ